jgi:hypothetical protein
MMLLPLVAVLALQIGCSSPDQQTTLNSGNEKQRDGAQDTDSAQVSDGAGAAAAPAHCCALSVSDPTASDNCSVLYSSSMGVVEPCFDGNSGGSFGLWTCGPGSPQVQCGANGLNCTIGDPCTLLDVGCQGVVQECDYPWYPADPG